MAALLDNNKYDDNDLMQVKFALNMPYMTGNKDYERCNGQVEYNGIQYNYVKRMVQNDTLYLYCIPNKAKTDISNTKNEYAKQNADNPTGKKSEHSVLKQMNFQQEYNSHIAAFEFNHYTSVSTHAITFNNSLIAKGFATSLLQPPDLFI